MALQKLTQATVRWRDSLIVRAMVLCGVLILCLLGAVYILTGHYYQQMIRDMDAEAATIARSIEVSLEENPLEDPRDLPKEVLDFDSERVDVYFMPSSEGPSREQHQDPAGNYVLVSTEYIPVGDEDWLLTIRFSIDPQTEIVRAFKNRYLALLSLGFLIALGLMLYLIAKTLRPLRELSDSCAQISEGNLEPLKIQGTTGEVLALETTFNQMVESLREKEVVEANLRQAQRLSSIGNLAAGVAHDVRNPLNAIKLLSSHAIDTLEDGDGVAGATKQLRTIRTEVNRLEEIVSGFLSLAREEELHREPQVIDTLLEECVRLVQKDAEDRQVHFTSELRCGDTQLMLDRKQWSRALINVLINALEACPPGGRVRLFSRRTENACEVEVRDDGPGMSEETLERAFDAYYTTKTTGTGLGLSITRGVVEEHGGKITLSSSAGNGCQVLISIPLKLPEDIPKNQTGDQAKAADTPAKRSYGTV